MDTTSDLHQLVEAASGAAADLGIPPQPSPWLPPLPEIVSLASIATGDSDEGGALGLVDEPELQRQRVLRFDPARDGSLLVYGTSGSGKTTLLRTLAVSLASQSTPEDLHIYGLDFATRGLDPLQALPHCGAVVTGEDGERVARLFSLASKAIARRKELISQNDPAAQLPRIVILLDGYAAFTAAYDRVDGGELVEALPRLVSDGRPLGVHFAIAAERRGAVRPALTSVIQNRVVLRMADDEEYAALGIEPRLFRGVTLPHGRGFAGRHEVQCALVGDDPGAEGSALEAAGERLRKRHGDTSAPPILPLPSAVSREELPSPERPLEVFLGLSDETMEPVSASLSEGHFFVAGPRRSGRSTTLETIARGLRTATPAVELHLAAPRRSPLPSLEIWSSVASGLQECESLLSSLAARVEALPAGGGQPIVLVVDDGNELTEGKTASALETISRRGRDLGVWVVAATEAQAAHRTFGGWLRELRSEEHGLLLMPQVDIDGDLLGVRLPRRSATGFPPGRGYLVQRGRIELVQVAG